MIARAPGSTQRQMQKQQTTAGGETLSFDYTFDIPVEVAAAVFKYRHDRWKFEWGKPQFTRLDVAIGSIASLWPSADYFRSSPGNGHRSMRSACLKRANRRLTIALFHLFRAAGVGVPIAVSCIQR